MYIPDSFGHFLDCSWFVTAPPNTYVLIKFQQLDLPECCDTLSIGEGTDIYNRTTVNKRLRGGAGTKPIILPNNTVWLRLQSDEYIEAPEKFMIEFHAISPTGKL